MLLKFAIICLLASANAATSSRSINGGFQGGSLVKADLSFLCIFAFLYLLFTALCIPILLRKAGKRSGVFITLFLSILFITIRTVASVFSVVIQSDGITPSQSSLGPTAVALSALVEYFGVWSLSLLFLSICLLIRDRQLALHKARISVVFPSVYYALFALLMVLGTVDASLYVDYLTIVSTGDFGAGHSFAWINHKIAISNDLALTFSSLWYLSSVVTLLYAVEVYRGMCRISVRDKVLRTVLFGIVPAYILMAVEEIIFTILTSPAGIKVDAKARPTQIEGIDFSSDFLSNFFYAIMYGILVALGLTRKHWQVEAGDELPRQPRLLFIRSDALLIDIFIEKTFVLYIY